MSLHNDFGMYYSGSYIGVIQESGEILPFYVECVTNNRSLFDLNSIPRSYRAREEYGDAAYNALVFHGNLYGSNGRVKAYHACVATNTLVFDLPDPKYIKINNQYYWCSYRSNRSTKKGLCDRRFSSNIQLSSDVAYSLFNEIEDENIIDGIFLRHGNKLDYKGIPIGGINGTDVALCAEANHLSKVLQKGWPECQITVMTS